MRCPIRFETLASWWLHELSDTEAEEVEAHLFSCDACAASSERLERLVRGLREWTPPVISHAHRDRLAARGKKLRLTPVDDGVDAQARFDRDVDLLIHELRGELASAERVHVVIETQSGDLIAQLDDVPFDRSKGEVLIACQRHYQMFGADPVFRVYAEEKGARRVVGRYCVVHEWV